MRRTGSAFCGTWAMIWVNRSPIIRASPAFARETRVEVFRRFFEQIVQQCQEAGLVWGKEMYFDGTKVAANAGKESLTPRFAFEAHLLNLFGTATEEDGTNGEPASLIEQRDEGQEELPALVPLPTSLSQEEHEQLARQNAERHDWLAELGAQNRSVKSHNYQRTADYFVSATDPDATVMRTKGGVDLGYHTRLSRGWRQITYHLERPGDAEGA